ncbi:MAG: OmpA family protein [Planctomycetota bacterium]
MKGWIHMRTLRCLLMCGLMLPAAGMVGCSNNKADDALLAQYQRENEELRDREAQLRAALDDAEGRNAGLSDERARLSAELAQARGELAEAEANTGFEGIGGTSTSMRGSDIVVDVAGDVLFASGSVSLRSQSKKTLDQIAAVLNSRYAGNEIRIAGHTDNDPIRKSKWKTNERLSAERALAVEEYLGSKGVDKNRMHIAGYGPAVPRGSKSQSRRVEIVVIGR